jgi:hypothetical protein
MTRQEYQGLALKTLTMLWPLRYKYEPTTPDGTITLYPVPSTAATLVLYVLTVLSAFATLDTAYTFQPGYLGAFYYNLAVRFMRPFGCKLDGDDLGLLLRQAQTGKANVKRMNEVPIDLPVDPAVLGGNRGLYDINSDSTYR